MLFSTAHFPPIQYFSKIIDLKEMYIEAFENYQKQSYRNRFKVLAANGPIDLSLPLYKGHTPGQAVKDVKIDYTESWNRVHFKTIKSAYNHSPFYEFYIDELIHFWERKYIFLYDLNLEILATLLDLLEIDVKVNETSTFRKLDPDNKDDFRNSIHPKKDWKNDRLFSPIPYTQNFSEKHDFVPNLSIIDLLFQKGPETVDVIKKSRKH